MTERERLRELLDELGREGQTVMDLARGRQPAEAWRLYPGEEGIFDRSTRSQFYYHAHDGRSEEDGHFHTVRLFDDHTVHLVAISMAPDGWPRALFTVNCWATGDAPASIRDLTRYARRFQIDERRGPPALVRFVNLMFGAFRSEIERLQAEKMAALAVYGRAYPGRNVFEDRSLEVLSRVAVDVRRDIRVGVMPS
ncbi:MAG: hypothetical protein HY216_06745 [Candidatus Rokubacteria bacterium]|nr:hypothetical protein [Candidatus Rokubacteria bacterium]